MTTKFSASSAIISQHPHDCLWNFQSAEAVANLQLGEQMDRLRMVVLELLPKLSHVDADIVGPFSITRSPMSMSSCRCVSTLPCP